MTRFSPFRNATVLAPFLMMAFFLTISSQAKAQAADTPSCDASTLNGKYMVKMSGTYYDNQYNFYLVAILGTYSMDGAGAITGQDTFSNDGSVSRRTVTGSYTLNSDCTGTVTFTGSDKTTLHADIVVNSNKTVEMVGTDNLTIFTGSATPR